MHILSQLNTLKLPEAFLLLLAAAFGTCAELRDRAAAAFCRAVDIHSGLRDCCSAPDISAEPYFSDQRAGSLT